MANNCSDCIHVLERGETSACLTCCHGRPDKFEAKETGNEGFLNVKEELAWTRRELERAKKRSAYWCSELERADGDIKKLEECCEAALSYMQDDSRSERRRQANIRGLMEVLPKDTQNNTMSRQKLTAKQHPKMGG